MSSNDSEHAQSGDMIEITTHLRNDLGKRMQVSTSDGLSVVALDNRMRVTVAHGDYKVVRRCGRPATDDAPKRKVGRPSNAELAARAAAEEVPKAKVEPKAVATHMHESLASIPPAGTPLSAAAIGGNDVIVTDADVAGLEAALYDVQVTRKAKHRYEIPNPGPADSWAPPGERETAPAGVKAALTVDESKVTVQSDDVSIEAAVELMTLRPLHSITQEEFDAMTTHVEPRGFLPPERKYTHYFKDASQFDVIDVYRVLTLFNVTDPCLQHAVKKLLVAGGRGHKDIGKDIQETIDALARWQDMRDEERDAA